MNFKKHLERINDSKKFNEVDIILTVIIGIFILVIWIFYLLTGWLGAIIVGIFSALLLFYSLFSPRSDY